MLRLAVDIGGTFTDAVIIDDEKRRAHLSKVPSTPSNYADGVVESIRKIVNSMDEIESFTHGTTVGTNALIQGTVASTGLLTTKGFRDILEIGRGNRIQIYDMFYKPPPPLVPRDRRVEVEERIGYDGKVMTPLNLEDCTEKITQLIQSGVETIAICLINSYANNEHEKTLQELVRKRFPKSYVSVSTDITREYNEFERTSTIVINASLLPIMERYLISLEDAIFENGYRGKLMLIQSNGGTMTSSSARTRPVNTINSGLVGGIIAVRALSRILGLRDVIGADMGGTSFDVELLVNGEYETSPMMKIRTPNSGFDGYPLQIPAVDIHAIGAGGGSIAWADSGGALHVGPMSTAASPGPACYGKGGKEPTVTDANIVLRRLNPEQFLGGQMEIYPELSAEALGRIAEVSGLDIFGIADGIIKIVVADMSGAIRTMTVRRGLDPRGFSMVSFGGAGPMHSALIAQELQIPKIIVSTMPGNFSAWGMLMSDIRRDYAKTYIRRFDELDIRDLSDELIKIEEDAMKTLKEEGVQAEDVRFMRGLDVSYEGQGKAVTVPAPSSCLTEGDKARIAFDFDQAHLTRYLHNAPEEPKRLIAIRVSALGSTKKAALPKIKVGSDEPSASARRKSRDVFVDGAFKPCSIYDRARLLANNVIRGPAIVEERASTTLLLEGQKIVVDVYGHLVITPDRGEN